MPEMIMNRNFTLRTTSGHSVKFVKDVPSYVVPHIMDEAMKYGALPLNEADMPQGEDDTIVKTVPQGEDRTAKITAILKEIMARKNRSDFTAAGRPNLKIIRNLLGFEVDGGERDAIWDKLLHPEQD